MKRGGPLRRRTPLRAVTPLSSSGSLARVVPLHGTAMPSTSVVPFTPRPRKRPRDTGPSKSVDVLLRERSGGLCELCTAPATNRQHRRPRGAGGSRDPLTNSVANLLHVCGSGTTGCHGHIESNRAEGYRLGHLVRQGQDPRAVPVFLYDHGWCLLDDAGGVSPCPPPSDRTDAA